MVSRSLKEEIIEAFEFVNGHSDVWRLFYNSNLFPRIVDELSRPFAESGVSKVAGIEARGFILGAAVAAHLGVGFVAIRKGEGLYPGPKVELEASSDYRGNRNILRLQEAAVARGDRILLVDDWFETGSQAFTAKALIESLGGVMVGCSIIVDELGDARRGELGRLERILEAAVLDK